MKAYAGFVTVLTKNQSQLKESQLEYTIDVYSLKSIFIKANLPSSTEKNLLELPNYNRQTASCTYIIFPRLPSSQSKQICMKIKLNGNAS